MVTFGGWLSRWPATGSWMEEMASSRMCNYDGSAVLRRLWSLYNSFPYKDRPGDTLQHTHAIGPRP